MPPAPPLLPTLLTRRFLPNLKSTPPARRPFLTSLLKSATGASSDPISIRVTRTLPHPRHQLYDLIADVDAYASFLPYCQSSRVTAWSDPTPRGAGAEVGAARRWPTEGDLTVGFGPVVQSYTSKIRCVPGLSVEASSGEAAARLGGSSDGGFAPVSAVAEKSGPIRSLYTKWTLSDDRSGGGEEVWTKVDLDVSVQVADPLMQALVAKVADEVAEKMIDAFEERADELDRS